MPVGWKHSRAEQRFEVRLLETGVFGVVVAECRAVRLVYGQLVVEESPR